MPKGVVFLFFSAGRVLMDPGQQMYAPDKDVLTIHTCGERTEGARTAAKELQSSSNCKSVVQPSADECMHVCTQHEDCTVLVLPL